MTYVKVNIGKPGVNAGIGSKKGNIVYLIDVDDINKQTFQLDGLEVLTCDMISGKYAVSIFAERMSINGATDSEGDFGAKGVIHTLDFSHPGEEYELRLFRQNWLNREVIAIIENCQSGFRTCFGTPCEPLMLDFKHKDDKDKNGTTFTLKSITKSEMDKLLFSASITLATVMGTAAANATTVNCGAGQGEYQLTTGASTAATIQKLTNIQHGGIYTLLGSGGQYPSVIQDKAGTPTSDFYLKDGTTWTALANSKLTVKAFSAGSAFVFFEISRT